MRITLQNIYHEPGTWVVDSYPLGQHVASIGKVEKSLLLLLFRHPENVSSLNSLFSKHLSMFMLIM